MTLEKRYAEHPDDVKRYDTKTLREHFLFDKVFVKEQISLCVPSYTAAKGGVRTLF